MTEQNEAYERLIKILEKLFQLDQADLDFGIYRIMNQKREEVSDFLENRLVTQIKETLEAHADEDKEKLKKELDNLEETLRDAGVEVDSNEKVLSLRKQLAKTDVTDLQNNVFSHLTNFFKRYYKEGDFISQRRYKDDAYAIPYQGEEVKLYWANHDQYYIKTSEYFKNYRFKLRNDKWVNFELREASTEQNNNKAQNGERKFKLVEENIYSEDENTLTIYFTYEPMSKKKKQKKLRKWALETLKEELPSSWLTELLQPNPTKSNKDRTELEKHLKEYTARNTFDYFIHKDLGKFLRRELDFYIKNEILHIDDIDLDKQESYQQSLQVVKAFKKVALKIIRFLAQIEDFQKKLWLKKKFVLQSDYCITLDRVDEDFYADIAENDRQRKEWVDLYAIDELDGYSEPLTVEFLKDNPFLMVDTKFFDREWKYSLLATLDDLDEQTNGLMINSENFQALKLLASKFQREIKCIYIDPPYNTDAIPILYKNNYRHSSWLSLMSSRLEESKFLLSKDGVLSIAIDDYELAKLSQLLEEKFHNHDLQRTIVNHYPGSGTGRTNVTRTHEYNLFVLPEVDDMVQGKLTKGGVRTRGFRRAGTGENNFRTGRPNSFFAVLIDEETYEVKGVEEPPEGDDYPMDKTEDGWKRIYPIGEDGSERVWSLSYEGAKEALEENLLDCTENETIKRIYHDDPSRELMQSVWLNEKFNASTWGTNLLTHLFGEAGKFSYPKSVYTVQTAIDSILQDDAKYVLDYFAGSGTTAHAVINLNREDENGNRKYIMVEMGEYFNSVTKPRVQKVAYSKEWKDGKPVDREGISHCFKYLRLESYEDTLNNLSLKRNGQQQELMENEDLREEYILNYMLEVEARDSLLTTEMFKKPFGYTLEATEHNERKETEVDLVETFNYLIGLQVENIQLKQGCVIVVGHNNDGEQILVIWRDLEEHDNEALEKFYRTIDLPVEKKKLDTIYVNGDDNLQTIRQKGEGWKVKLIEKEFHKRMFEKKGL